MQHKLELTEVSPWLNDDPSSHPEPNDAHSYTDSLSQFFYKFLFLHLESLIVLVQL